MSRLLSLVLFPSPPRLLLLLLPPSALFAVRDIPSKKAHCGLEAALCALNTLLLHSLLLFDSFLLLFTLRRSQHFSFFPGSGDTQRRGGGGGGGGSRTWRGGDIRL